MNRRVCFLIAALVSLSLFSGALYAAQPAFEGKTIRIVVGFSAGGGFDTIPGPLPGTWENIFPVILRSLWRI